MKETLKLVNRMVKAGLIEDYAIDIQAMKKYPDISEIIKQKERLRRSLAALPFEKKIEMVFKLQERRKFVKSGRVANNSHAPKTKKF